MSAERTIGGDAPCPAARWAFPTLLPGRIVWGVTIDALAKHRLTRPIADARWWLIAVMVMFLAIDVIIGERVFNVFAPALLAGLVITYGVALAARYLLPATVIAAAASVAVSFMVDHASITSYTPVMGRGAWPGFAELAGLGFLVGWCVRSLPGVQAFVATASAAVALYGLVDLRQDGPYRAELQAILAAGLITAIAAGGYLRRIDNLQVRQTNQARHDERLAIARELHDVVAHHVTGIVVQAQAARLVADSNPDAPATALQSIENAGAEALTAMRRMVGALREEGAEAPLAPAATLSDLRALAHRTTELGLPVRLRVNAAEATLPPELNVSIHRIVGEALTNAQRHAVGATRVDVAVMVEDDHVNVWVIDDGRVGRLPRGERAGFGITGMAERVASLGGRFLAGPRTGGGWQVLAQLPIAGARS